jgi:predicted enzyme related to lactoylglutathione lyase
MIKHLQIIETILYVKDQKKSCAFYQNLFRTPADLDVPGMTEFMISERSKIGLMPNKGIANLLGENTPHPDLGNGIPRCELYFYVEDLQLEFENALACGAKLISTILDRDWGDQACYFSDPDGHIIAFAKKITVSKT